MRFLWKWSRENDLSLKLLLVNLTDHLSPIGTFFQLLFSLEILQDWSLDKKVEEMRTNNQKTWSLKTSFSDHLITWHSGIIAPISVSRFTRRRHHTIGIDLVWFGIESMSLLLLPSAANFDFIGDVFPFTLCLDSVVSSPLTMTPLVSGCSLSPWCPLFLGVGVWAPEPFELRRDRDLMQEMETEIVVINNWLC